MQLATALRSIKAFHQGVPDYSGHTLMEQVPTLRTA